MLQVVGKVKPPLAALNKIAVSSAVMMNQSDRRLRKRLPFPWKPFLGPPLIQSVAPLAQLSFQYRTRLSNVKVLFIAEYETFRASSSFRRCLLMSSNLSRGNREVYHALLVGLPLRESFISGRAGLSRPFYSFS